MMQLQGLPFLQKAVATGWSLSRLVYLCLHSQVYRAQQQHVFAPELVIMYETYKDVMALSDHVRNSPPV